MNKLFTALIAGLFVFSINAFAEDAASTASADAAPATDAAPAADATTDATPAPVTDDTAK